TGARIKTRRPTAIPGRTGTTGSLMAMSTVMAMARFITPPHITKICSPRKPRSATERPRRRKLLKPESGDQDPSRNSEFPRGAGSRILERSGELLPHPDWGSSAVCSRVAYSDQERPWRSYLLPGGEGAPQGRMRDEMLALARKFPSSGRSGPTPQAGFPPLPAGEGEDVPPRLQLNGKTR